MTIFRSDNLFVGLVALALVPLIGWRIWRGVRDGRLAIYRTYVSRDERPGRFNVMLVLHTLSFLLIAAIAGDLLFGVDIRSAL